MWDWFLGLDSVFSEDDPSVDRVEKGIPDQRRKPSLTPGSPRAGVGWDVQQRFLERMTSLPRMQGPVSADQVNRGKEKEGPRMFWTYAKAHGRSSHYCLKKRSSLKIRMQVVAESQIRKTTPLMDRWVMKEFKVFELESESKKDSLKVFKQLKKTNS